MQIEANIGLCKPLFNQSAAGILVGGMRTLYIYIYIYIYVYRPILFNIVMESEVLSLYVARFEMNNSVQSDGM